jgi:hypothetical protein
VTHPLVLLLTRFMLTRFIHTVLSSSSSLRMWAWQTVLLIKGSYNLARIGWQFSLCVSRLTKCWHHLPHILSWVSLQGTSQLTTNEQTNSFFGGGKGLNCMMQMTVADLSTMTKQWHPFCAADLPQVQRLQKGSLCCKCVPGHWRWPQHSYHTYLPSEVCLQGGFLTSCVNM